MHIILWLEQRQNGVRCFMWIGSNCAGHDRHEAKPILMINIVWLMMDVWLMYDWCMIDENYEYLNMITWLGCSRLIPSSLCFCWLLPNSIFNNFNRFSWKQLCLGLHPLRLSSIHQLYHPKSALLSYPLRSISPSLLTASHSFRLMSTNAISIYFSNWPMTAKNPIDSE